MLNKKQSQSLNHSTRTRQQREQQKQTIYYADSRSKVKNSAFHWNIGTPRTFNTNIQTTKVNDENPKKDFYRNKNVELAPLSPQLKSERDKFFSQKKVKINSF